MLVKRIRNALLGAAAAFLVAASGASANGVGHFNPDMTYYVAISKSCKKAGSLECGNLTIGRDRRGSGNKVLVSMYHQVCLGNVSEGRYRWIYSRVVRTSGNRFYVKIDRPTIKLKLRGRFIDGSSGKSQVKGTLGFRNLHRECGFRPFGFRVSRSGSSTDPQG